MSISPFYISRDKFNMCSYVIKNYIFYTQNFIKRKKFAVFVK